MFQKKRESFLFYLKTDIVSPHISADWLNDSCITQNFTGFGECLYNARRIRHILKIAKLGKIIWKRTFLLDLSLYCYRKSLEFLAVCCLETRKKSSKTFMKRRLREFSDIIASCFFMLFLTMHDLSLSETHNKTSFLKL